MTWATPFGSEVAQVRSPGSLHNRWCCDPELKPPCESREFDFFMAKTLLSLELVDANNSVSRPLPDGGVSLTKLAYFDDSRTDFYIARDVVEVFDVVVSERLKALCANLGLNINFIAKSCF
ncbi:hypothetical protein [Xanthomonas oryzae]|uniref:hypothetical protein n=2 Tax=Xanthomonas oryzae TaxID=347 RepID=UPI00094A115E|nr:hypothetical protein [Xanthomonas oryzae]RBL06714.1 hypothetical protein BRN33_23325 [Xanthomonas oryzae pv. oryzae]UWU53990.1 hypothetical protein BRN95_17300 [Xanthomonas oryzae pv. oryzae]UXV91078.1 hypothetical protein IXO597_016395 [Xanthomonas oryzae pv. oryzae]